MTSWNTPNGPGSVFPFRGAQKLVPRVMQLLHKQSQMPQAVPAAHAAHTARWPRGCPGGPGRTFGVRKTSQNRMLPKEMCRDWDVYLFFRFGVYHNFSKDAMYDLTYISDPNVWFLWHTHLMKTNKTFIFVCKKLVATEASEITLPFLWRSNSR